MAKAEGGQHTVRGSLTHMSVSPFKRFLLDDWQQRLQLTVVAL